MKDQKDKINSAPKKVSVIIPVYSTSSNIRRCLDSVAGQTMKEIEVILVCTIADGEMPNAVKDCAREDPRFAVVKRPGLMPGAACNEGIGASSCDYVCFVDPNDWIEPEMLETLHETACKHRVDMVKAFVYLHGDGGDPQVQNYFYEKPEILNNRTSDRYLLADFYLRDPVRLSALFKKEFLTDNGIRFSGVSSYGYYDLGFAFFSMCSASSLYISRSALYHHEPNPQGVTAPPGHGDCEDVLREHGFICERLKSEMYDTRLMQIEAARAFWDTERLLGGLKTLGQRSAFLRQSSAVLMQFIPYITDSCYLPKQKTATFRAYASHPVWSALWLKKNLHMKALRFFLEFRFAKGVSYIRILRFPVFFTKKTGDYFTFNVFKVPIIRRKLYGKRIIEGAVTTKRYYLFAIRVAKTVEDPDYISFFIFGFCIMKKDNEKARPRLTADDIVYYTGIANAVSDTHSKTFPQFRNTNRGQGIAIFGAGPSMNFAPPVENCKTIACNRSVEFFKQGDPDYFFVHNYHGSKSIFDRILKMKSHLFFGCFINKEAYIHSSIPEQLRLNDNVYKYYFVSGALGAIRAEIEHFPLADFWTVVHPAMHFALYTNPDVIYLLGCDTTDNGYANKNVLQVRIDIDLMKAGYEKFREFRDVQYPNTRIVSVNPIGLRGMFEDVYTKEFVEQTPELDKSKVTIIEGI